AAAASWTTRYAARYSFGQCARKRASIAEADPFWASRTHARSWRGAPAIRQRLYERDRSGGPRRSHPVRLRAEARPRSGTSSSPRAVSPPVIRRLALMWLVAAALAGGSPVALVTAESANQVIAVSLPSGKVVRRVPVHNPETIAAGTTGPAVVASPSGTVTILAWRTLRTVAVLHGFDSPELAAITPDGTWAYVTDAATGELSAIALASHRVVDRVFVGRGAHHLAVAPDGHRTWVALGERATTIVVLDTSHPDRLRVIGQIHPPTLAHDLAVAPDG